MKHYPALLLCYVFFLSSAVYGNIAVDKYSIKPEKREQIIIAGVVVELTVNAATFPESWLTDEINAKGIDLDSAEAKRSILIIKKAFEKYPNEVLTHNLKKIVMLKYIEFYGQEFGGTNSTDVIYVTNDGVNEGYTDKYIEQTIHHEFSSILLRNYPDLFNEKKWIRMNKKEYGTGGVDALKNKNDSQVLDEVLMKDGFLDQYSLSDMENDFNSFAQNIFCYDKVFWDYGDKYPGINNKLKVIISFYSKLDKTFSKEYFVSVSKQ